MIYTMTMLLNTVIKIDKKKREVSAFVQGWLVFYKYEEII